MNIHGWKLLKKRITRSIHDELSKEKNKQNYQKIRDLYDKRTRVSKRITQLRRERDKEKNKSMSRKQNKEKRNNEGGTRHAGKRG